MTLYHCLQCKTPIKFKGHSYQHKYCDNKCQASHTRAQRLKEWKQGKAWKGRMVPFWIKDENGFLAQRDGYKCSVCGIKEHNGKKIVLECDHIDGVPTNHNPKNLRLICPNCHSQTTTFKGRNK
jgi:5-methylcytosine-specific restriction endonuclease McrA